MRYLVAHGLDRTTALAIINEATDEWQHGNTLTSPMSVALAYVATRADLDRASPA